MAAEKAAGLPDGALEELRTRVGRVISAGPALGSGAGDTRAAGAATGTSAVASNRNLGSGVRVGIACSRFNGALTLRLLDGALDALDELGVDRNDVTVAWTPGAFELPLLARALVGAGVDTVVCLGAVVRGETGHYELVAGECARGIQRVQLETGVPVAFGVLTTDTAAQAFARVDKGREAAATAVEMVQLLRAVSY